MYLLSSTLIRNQGVVIILIIIIISFGKGLPLNTNS